jgi:ATP-dependent DNA helicase RecQ
LTQRSRSEPSFATENGQRQKLKEVVRTPAVLKSAVVMSKPVAAKPAVAVELTASQQQLEAQMREWRKKEAAASGLPSFFVLSDTVLRSIALAQPASIEELRAVRSLGAEKVERFGAAILGLCQAAG